MIVAVDGPAASGKGTLSKSLAAHYGLQHLDTGKTYRAVAYAMVCAGIPSDDEASAVRFAQSLDFATLADPALGTPQVAQMASKVAVMATLRQALVARQRAFAEDAIPGAVLDGRDIGTVVCPDAHAKLFITASAEERARRRAIETYGNPDGPEYSDLLAAILERDARDATRAASPMRPAADAHVIDTTSMTIPEALSAAIAIVDTAQEGAA